MTSERTSLPVRFVARAFVASALFMLVYGVAQISVQLANLLLLLFMAIVGGVGLRSLAEALRRRVHVGHGVALAIVLLTLVGATVGLGLAVAAPLQRQVEEARTQLPELQERLDAWLSKARANVTDATGSEPAPEGGGSPTGDMVEQLRNSPSGEVFTWVTGFIGGVTSAVGGAVLAVVIAVYLAAAPDRYLGGLVELVPIRHRPRVRQVLGEVGHELRAWIVGQVIAMTIVGVGTGLGLWLIGVKLALLLGIIAGLADFIPNFGPALAFVPAALVASGDGKIVPVIVLYVAIQVVEGWVLRPLIEQKAVDTLPAVLLGTQVLLGTLVGFMGLVVAPALIVLVQVLTRRFYVEDVLGDRSEDEVGSGGANSRGLHTN